MGVVVLGLAIAALLPAAYRMARPFVAAFVLAAILAVALNPLQNRASRLLKHSSLAALLTTLAGLGPILAILLLTVTMMVREIRSIDVSGIWRSDFGRAGEWLNAGTLTDRQAMVHKAAAQLGQASGALFAMALAVVFLYVMLLYGRGWVSQVRGMLPLDTEVTERIVSTTRDAIIANVNGVLANSAADAVVYGIVFGIAGVASPVMWALIAGFSTLLPIVGGTIVWLPIAVILAIHGTYAKALVVGVGCFAGQTAVDMLLRPRVIGNRLRLPPLVVFLAVLGGANAFGPLGILVGPVIVSVLAALAREFRLQLRPASG